METPSDNSTHFRSTITQWLILLGLVLGVTVTNGFARFSYGLMLPAIQAELNWNYMQAGWLGTINAIGYIVGAVFTMLLVQKFPSKYLCAVRSLPAVSPKTTNDTATNVTSASLKRLT